MKWIFIIGGIIVALYIIANYAGGAAINTIENEISQVAEDDVISPIGLSDASSGTVSIFTPFEVVNQFFSGIEAGIIP